MCDPETEVVILKWSEMDIAHLDLNTSRNFTSRNYENTPFPIDPVINSRVALWYGDPFSISADGIAQTTNETIDEMSNEIVQRTGSSYPRDVREKLRTIRTGEAKVVASHLNLPCRHLILTVSPKYSVKFQTAAETALYSCYNSVLQRSNERNMITVAIPPLHNGNKCIFPPELAVHIALRTVRRFLEKGHSIPNLIILSVSDPQLFELYQNLMICYFPRELQHENYACSVLPKEIGDVDGAPWCHDRRIRIFSNPAENGDEVDDEECNILDDLNRDFIKMKDDVDKERLLYDGKKKRSLTSLNDNERHIAIEIEAKERNERILRRARTEDLSEIAKTGCLYRCGEDRLGRKCIVVIGKWFKPERMDLDKAFLYLVKMLDDINSEYCVIYFHTGTNAENRPSFRWMRTVYDHMEYRFKKNLKSLSIVHPTMWTKVTLWWFLTFMAPAIKDKVQNVDGVQKLFTVIEPNQLQIPAFISEYDITVNGFRGLPVVYSHSTAGTPTSTSSHTPTTPVK